jgi:hypothetical protein
MNHFLLLRTVNRYVSGGGAVRLLPRLLGNLCGMLHMLPSSFF